MANGNLDFRFRSGQISPTVFADVIQRRRQVETQQEQAADQQRNSRFNRLIQAIQLGSQGVASMVKATEKRQERDRIDKLADTAASQFAPSAQSSLVGDGKLFPILPSTEQKRKQDLVRALVKQDPSQAAKLTVSSLGTQQRRAADTEIRTLEFADGTVKDVIVDKAQNKVFDLSGRELSKEILDQTRRGFAPTLTEDLEGRKALVPRGGGPTKVVFAEEEAPKGGKEKRIQFTPEGRKFIGDSRKQFASNEFVKKQGTTLQAIDEISELIEKNPRGAIGPIRTQIARVVAGEVGRLTDQDITRNIPTQEFSESFKQWMKMRFDFGGGSEEAATAFTKISKSRYLRLISILKTKKADTLNTILKDLTDDAVQFGIAGGNRNALRKTIGRGLVPFIDKFRTKTKQQTLSPAEEAANFFKGLQ